MNGRNRTSQPPRRCAGCSTSWRRSSTPGCASRPSRSPWPPSGQSSAPPSCGSSWPAASAARRQCSPVSEPSRETVLASYPEFLVLRTADGAEHLIRYGPAVSIALSAEPPPLRPTPAAASHRYQLALALRELARRREPVRALLADGTSCDGTIEAVGSDYLEIAEHHLGEARRRGAVRARRFIGFAAVVAVSLPQERR
jgi:hypothetical protein